LFVVVVDNAAPERQRPGSRGQAAARVWPRVSARAWRDGSRPDRKLSGGGGSSAPPPCSQPGGQGRGGLGVGGPAGGEAAGLDGGRMYPIGPDRPKRPHLWVRSLVRCVGAFSSGRERGRRQPASPSEKPTVRFSKLAELPCGSAPGFRAAGSTTVVTRTITSSTIPKFAVHRRGSPARVTGGRGEGRRGGVAGRMRRKGSRPTEYRVDGFADVALGSGVRLGRRGRLCRSPMRSAWESLGRAGRAVGAFLEVGTV